MEILPFLLWPFVASLILTGIHAYLGVHVVERGVIFVDLALAQIAALGATIAILIGMDPHDADRVLVGLPLMPASLELVGMEEVQIVIVEPDPEEGRMPHVQGSAGGPMIIVARASEDEEP